jgi:hypothetical protein
MSRGSLDGVERKNQSRSVNPMGLTLFKWKINHIKGIY